MEARAVSRYLRIAPRKARLVADLIRGKNVGEALMILDYVPKKAARIMTKTLRSVVANAENTQRVDVDQLYVRRVTVDGGSTLKRFMPRAHGRATQIRKRTSHLTIVVDEREKKE
jgi:large subunit ribosomal protein L22